MTACASRPPSCRQHTHSDAGLCVVTDSARLCLAAEVKCEATVYITFGVIVSRHGMSCNQVFPHHFTTKRQSKIIISTPPNYLIISSAHASADYIAHCRWAAKPRVRRIDDGGSASLRARMLFTPATTMRRVGPLCGSHWNRLLIPAKNARNVLCSLLETSRGWRHCRRSSAVDE